MNGEQVSQKQLIILLVFFIFGTIIFSLPRGLAIKANHSGWVSILLAMGLFLLFSLLVVKVGRNMEIRGLDMIGYCHYIFGALAGRIFTFVFVLIPLLLFAAITLRIGAELFATLLLPETPLVVIMAMILYLRYALVLGGMGSISRWSELIMPFVVGMMCILITLSFSNFKLELAKPLFDSSIVGIVKGNQLVLGAFAEAAVLLFFWYSIQQRKRTIRSLVIVNLLLGILFVIIFFITIGAYGVSSTKRMTYPVIEVIRDISFVELIEHLESFSFVAWMMVMVSKGSLTFYVCCDGWRSWFGMKDYRSLMMPITLIIFFLSLLPQNIIEAAVDYESFKARLFPLYAFIFLTVLIVMDYLRKKSAS